MTCSVEFKVGSRSLSVAVVLGAWLFSLNPAELGHPEGLLAAACRHMVLGSSRSALTYKHTIPCTGTV